TPRATPCRPASSADAAPRTNPPIRPRIPARQFPRPPSTRPTCSIRQAAFRASRFTLRGHGLFPELPQHLAFPRLPLVHRFDVNNDFEARYRFDESVFDEVPEVMRRAN